MRRALKTHPHHLHQTSVGPILLSARFGKSYAVLVIVAVVQDTVQKPKTELQFWGPQGSVSGSPYQCYYHFLMSKSYSFNFVLITALRVAEFFSVYCPPCRLLLRGCSSCRISSTGPPESSGAAVIKINYWGCKS